MLLSAFYPSLKGLKYLFLSWQAIEESWLGLTDFQQSVFLPSLVVLWCLCGCVHRVASPLSFRFPILPPHPWNALFHKFSPLVYHITYIVKHSNSFPFLFFSRNLFDWMWWHWRQNCGKILNAKKSISATWILRSKLWFPDLLCIKLDKLDELKKLYWLVYLPPSQSNVCEHYLLSALSDYSIY